MEFKDSLSRILNNRGMSQADLCRISGVATSAMSRYLSGDSDPSLSKAIAMADALQISLDELAGREVPKRAAERELLTHFRNLSDEGQEVAVNTVYGLSATYKKRYQPEMVAREEVA